MDDFALGFDDADPIGIAFGSDPSFGFDMGEQQAVGDYNALVNKPSIEGHVLVGDSTIGQIGVGELTPQEIDRIIYG